MSDINRKTYVGSSVDLKRRFYQYYSLHTLETSNMIIYKAILKYGYSNFSLYILEYCDESILIEREQYYLDLFKPEYNSLKIAGNTLGYIHSEGTIAKMSEKKSGKNNHFFGKTHSKEAKLKTSSTSSGNTHSEETKDKMSRAKGSIIYVHNLRLFIIVYFSFCKKDWNTFWISS